MIIDENEPIVINSLSSTSIKNALSALQGKNLNDMITSLMTELSGTQQDVADNMTDIGTLQGKVQTLEADNTTNKTNISALQNTDTDLQNQINQRVSLTADQSIGGTKNFTGTVEGLGKLTVIKTSSGNADTIGTATVSSLSNFNFILITYDYGSTSGNLVCNLYPTGLLKTLTTQTQIGDNGNYHSLNFNVTYSSSNDTLTMAYLSNSRAFNACIYGIN